MKILHLTTHLNRGGIARYIFSVGSAFLKRGHQIFVGSSGGEMEPEFREVDFRLRNFPIRTKSELSPKIYFALPQLMQWISEEQIDLIHAHTRVTQVMGQWVSWLTRKSFVTTCHGFYKRRLGRRILPAWGDLVVAISEPVGEHLRETFRVPVNRIRVIYNGIDFQAFVHRFLEHDPSQVRREYGIAPGSRVVGVTARLVPDKGHEYLIRAIKTLESEMPDLNLLIVGDGRYRSHLEELSRRLRIRNRIRFAGNVRDVSRPLAAMDAFVLPAVWREGFGLSIVEAMVCEKPVIVTNIWALNALIQDRVNGILVEPRNVENLAEAIHLILEDNAFRQKIGNMGRKTAEERFSLDRMVRDLEGVYTEVLHGIG